MARPALHRFDRALKGRKFEPLDERPDHPRTALGRNQLVEAQSPKLDLPALRAPQRRAPGPPRFRRAAGHLLAQENRLLTAPAFDPRA